MGLNVDGLNPIPKDKGFQTTPLCKRSSEKQYENKNPETDQRISGFFIWATCTQKKQYAKPYRPSLF